MGRKLKKTTPIRSTPEPVPTPQPPPLAAVVSASSSSTSGTSSSFSDAAVQTTAKSSVSPQHSVDESESQSDSDSDPKPIPKFPESESESDSDTTPPSNKPIPRPSYKPVNKRVDKRPAETTRSPNITTKRVKKDQTNSVSGSVSVLGLDATPATPGKTVFQRIWSDEDELVILKGLIDYRANKGVDPMTNVDDFLVFIKNSLHVVDANKTQIVGKVRRLKKRFLNSLKKKVTDPHEIKANEYSKKIWPSSLSANEPKKPVLVHDGVEIAVVGEEAKKKTNVVVEKAKKKANRGVEIAGDGVEAKKKANVVEEKAIVGNGGVGNVGMDVDVDVEVRLGFDEESVAVLREAMKMVEGEERKEIKTMVEKANVAYLDAYVLRLKVLEIAAKKLLDGIKNDQC